jgi:hypothetical protein
VHGEEGLNMPRWRSAARQQRLGRGSSVIVAVVPFDSESEAQ